MIPDYQSLMRPVLTASSEGEIHIQEVVSRLGNELHLSEDEKAQLLPSGKKTKFANRVEWAKTYLKQAGLVGSTKRGYFRITERGQQALDDNVEVNNVYLSQFEEFQEFKSRSKESVSDNNGKQALEFEDKTPDEILRSSYETLKNTLGAEIIEKLRCVSPQRFEKVIVELLIAMGYGGSSENAGRALGQSGDDGIDGVIDQDPLGVDQVYVQAKRYQETNNVGSGAIRDFFGALNLKKAQKGIFVTTSDFTPSALQTAKDLGMRLVLINGEQLSKLMIRYNVGCRDEDVIYIKQINYDYFE